MKHKFLVVLLAVATTLCMVFGFAGCSLSDLFGGKESGKTDPSIVDPSGDDKEQGGSGQTEKPKPSFPESGYAENGLYFELNSDGESYAVYKGDFNGSDLVIPDTFNGAPVTSIGNEAFFGCSGLTSIEIPNSVTSIGNRAFEECIGLTGELKIPGSVTSIGENVFAYCIGLKNVTIESGPIEYMEFRGCSGLTSVTICSGVTSIENDAFNRIRDTAKNQKNILKRSLSRA